MASGSGEGGGDYLLGSEDEEIARLGVQHQVWAAPARDLWERAGFGVGDALLDLGCGPGYSTLELAERVGPTGRVMAVDSSPKFVAHLRAQVASRGLTNVDVREDDVHEIDLGEATLDGAYARWVLCFVREPDSVVRKVARALRPGAAFATTDYFNYRAFTFAPRSDLMDRIVVAVQRAWRQRGGDLEVQGRMPPMMERAGLGVTDVRAIHRVARPGDALWEWPRSFFRGFLPTLVELKLISAEDSRAFLQEWDERSARSDGFLCPPPMFDVIGVKR